MSFFLKSPEQFSYSHMMLKVFDFLLTASLKILQKSVFIVKIHTETIVDA